MPDSPGENCSGQVTHHVWEQQGNHEAYQLPPLSLDAVARGRRMANQLLIGGREMGPVVAGGGWVVGRAGEGGETR